LGPAHSQKMQNLWGGKGGGWSKGGCLFSKGKSSGQKRGNVAAYISKEKTETRRKKGRHGSENAAGEKIACKVGPRVGENDTENRRKKKKKKGREAGWETPTAKILG